MTATAQQQAATTSTTMESQRRGGAPRTVRAWSSTSSLIVRCAALRQARAPRGGCGDACSRENLWPSQVTSTRPIKKNIYWKPTQPPCLPVLRTTSTLHGIAGDDGAALFFDCGGAGAFQNPQHLPPHPSRLQWRQRLAASAARTTVPFRPFLSAAILEWSRRTWRSSVRRSRHAMSASARAWSGGAEPDASAARKARQRRRPARAYCRPLLGASRLFCSCYSCRPGTRRRLRATHRWLRGAARR